MTGRRTHGHTAGPAGSNTTTPEYRSWMGMIQRCTNPNAEKFPLYGGRGIGVCERWRKFDNFYQDMGPRPEGKTLDRIDPNKGYEPGNCRWATPKEQAANRRPFLNPNSKKTHCPAGHPYEGENLHVTKDGDRKCRACTNEHARAARKRRAAASPPQPKPLRSHCPAGHPYTGDNLHITSGGERKCRACGRERARVRRQSKRNATSTGDAT